METTIKNKLPQEPALAEACQREAIAIFDAAIARAPNADVRATRELLKAYFTNPKARAAIADFVFEVNR